MIRKKRKEMALGPIITTIIFVIIVIFLSFIFSKLGLTTTKSEIINGEISTVNIGVNNLLSKEGFQFLISSIVSNFQNFNVLYIFIISMLGIGFADNSGLLKRLLKNARKYKLSFIITLTLFFGCLMGTLGTDIYAFLLPLAGYVYKNLNKNPIVGIVATFIALTIGQATCLLPTYLNQVLGGATQTSAVLTVDGNYIFKSSSLIYIFVSSFFLFILLGSIIIDKYLVPKVPKMKAEEEIEELEVNHGGLKKSVIAFLVMLFILVYCLIPGLPFSGGLLGTGSNYLERVFADGAPFKESYIFLFSLIMIVCGTIYAIIEKKIKNFDDFTRTFTKCFSGLSIVFVTMFFISQLVAVINWSGIDVFLVSLFVNWLSLLKITGLGLIIIYFFIVVLVSIILPDTMTKWNLLVSTAVPLLMRANISASFAQFIFMVGDGIGKSASIIFPAVAILLGLFYKYTDNGNYGFIKIYKMLLPTLTLFTIVWLIIIITWYVVGIPTGIGILPNL